MQPEQPIDQSAPSTPVDDIPLVEPTELEPADQPVQWQAPEYVQERRSPWWFIIFWIVTVALMAVAIFLMKSISFAVLVPAMAAALMIYSHRPPRMLNYVLSNKGVYINEKLHPMSEFRSFGVLTDESIPSLMLIPTKRFRPGLTLHFPDEYGEAIVDVLGGHLPMKELRLDIFDQLIRKLHI